MLKSDAVTLHNRPENRDKFPVFVWDEGDELVTYVDFYGVPLDECLRT